ncbi:MAG: class I SAM-dependent methyltransferase [Bdellovibrionales bacterium]
MKFSTRRGLSAHLLRLLIVLQLVLITSHLHAGNRLVDYCSSLLSSAKSKIQTAFRLDYPRTILTTEPRYNNSSEDRILYEDIPIIETNRSPETILKLHRKSGEKYLSLTYLKNKKILDAGCGSTGFFVKNLNALGVDAYGIDIALNDSVISPKLSKQDMTHTWYNDKEFDVVVSTYSLLSYVTFAQIEKPIALALFNNALKELTRITRVGGVILIADLVTKHMRLNELLRDTDSLKLISETTNELSRKAIILKRIK